jgi:hypothetical protein|tara:strand:- start:48 stop:890 length:843 start_codon:yes stop_codon:yes gene_type:complete
MSNRSCKNKKNVKNPKRKSLKKKGGGKVKELLQEWEELSDRIFDPNQYGQNGLIPVNNIIEHLKKTNISIINDQDKDNMTIFHELVKRFFNKEEANYGLFLEEEFQVGIFEDVPPTHIYRNTFHYGTRRCFKLILELLSIPKLEINTRSNDGKAAINHLVEYLINIENEEDLDEEFAEVNYREIKEVLLPLMFIKGASIQSLTNEQVEFVLEMLSSMSVEGVEYAKDAAKQILRQKGTTPLLDIYNELLLEIQVGSEELENKQIPEGPINMVEGYLKLKN